MPVVGGILVVVTLYDLAATVIGTGRGAGPLTGPVAERLWQGMLAIHQRTRHPTTLRRTGPSILVFIFVFWVSSLILGWAMVFGARESVFEVDTDQPLGFLGKVYFAAMTILGRGSSAGRPSTDSWQFLEMVAGVTGILLLSLAIAYFIPVVQAVVFKRKVALYITSLGESPEEILDTAWNGRDLGEFHLHLLALTPMITDLSQRYLAYPIVHYFHSSERATALGPSLVALDEVLTTNARLIHPKARVPDFATVPLRRAITALLQTLDVQFVEAVDADVDTKALDNLRSSGVPVVDELPDDPFSETTERRRLLRGYLEHDGWRDTGLLPRSAEQEARDREGASA